MDNHQEVLGLEGFQISGVQGANFNAGLWKGDNEEEK
ncbi:MAG: hypothetical protein CM15mP101_06730 [Flavobacteriaceae bacterium]|nr:MAG: hypothetical protein CM15mP101_06730 [Flavobacteriaceae bacterium]